MIKERFSDEFKDYAFIEFASIEEAANVIREFTLNPTQIKNKDLFLDFSKIRKIDELKKLSVQGGNSNNEAFVNCSLYN